MSEAETRLKKQIGTILDYDRESAEGIIFDLIHGRDAAYQNLEKNYKMQGAYLSFFESKCKDLESENDYLKKQISAKEATDYARAGGME